MSDASSSSASSSPSSRASDTDGTSILDAHDIDEVPVDVFDKAFYAFTVTDTYGRPFELNQRVSSAVSKLGEAKDMVASMCNVLNRIMNSYESSCNPRGAARVKFVEHSQAVLLHHPHKSNAPPARPHIIAVPECIASSYNRDVKSRSKRRATADPPAIAWHHVLAAILVNDSYDELVPVDLMVDLLGPLHQARPDLPGCFAVTATRGACRLWWSDAAWIYTTPRLAWDDPATATLLLNFACRLHHPLATDSTISLESIVQGRADYDQKPVWHVGDGLGGVYRVEHVIAVGKPWTRKNWIAASTEHRSGDARSFAPCSRVIIKDSFPPIDDEAFVEDAILDHLQEAGFIPGVCSPMSSFRVTNGDDYVRSVDVPNCKVTPRRKHRLVMRGDGEDLYQCPSVLQFVMMMYDLLEVLRYVHQQRGVLHRDISLRNVLLAPSDSPPTRESFPGCKFASEVLAHKYPQMKASSAPACVLIDFDNAFCEGRSPEAAAKQPVGTPAFAARNVSRNFRLVRSCAAVPFPELVGDAKECYLRTFGQQHYDDLTALYESRWAKPGRPEDAMHRPHHDAESCYYLTVHFLLTALPREATSDDDDSKAAGIVEILERNYFGNLLDLRDNIMDLLPEEWANYLHPELRSLGDFLVGLSETVLPIYDLFQPRLPPYHLHDAMQRVLLQEACRLLEDGALPLNITARRQFYSIFNILPTALKLQPVPASRKRGAEGLDDREDAGPRLRLSV